MNRCLNTFINVWYLILISGCISNEQKIDTIVLVVPDTYKGPIVVFFQQKEKKGQIEFRKGKHYFYVDSTGVFFTQMNPRKGGVNLEGLSLSSNEDIYSTEMSINQYSNETFKVVGGTYKGFRTKLYNDSSDFLNFCVFKAGKVEDLKNGGWYISDSVVKELYQKFQPK